MTGVHGVIQGYRGGCRCFPCRLASAEYRRRLRGEGPRFVDADLVRDHLQRLAGFGVGYRRVASLAGVGASTLGSLLYDRSDRPRSAAVTASTRDRVLSVTLPVVLARSSDDAPVVAVGAQRRLRALVAVGWSGAELARRLGMGKPAVTELIASGEMVRMGTWRSVCRLYDELWAVEPPSGSADERSVATRARRRAARNGWVPPAAWDDESIDDPAAVPHVGEKVRSFGRIDPAEVEWLRSFGTSDELIAAQMGLSVKSLRNVPRKRVAA